MATFCLQCVTGMKLNQQTNINYFQGNCLINLKFDSKYCHFDVTMTKCQNRHISKNEEVHDTMITSFFSTMYLYFGISLEDCILEKISKKFQKLLSMISEVATHMHFWLKAYICI